eukprot:743507-Pelagomonas_calceolata.AAC.2
MRSNGHMQARTQCGRTRNVVQRTALHRTYAGTCSTESQTTALSHRPVALSHRPIAQSHGPRQ